MRIFLALTLSLTFGTPVLAQNALWGTGGNNAQGGQNSSGQNSGQTNNQGNNQGNSQGGGQAGQRGQGQGRKRHHKSQQQGSNISGASSVKSYDEGGGARPSNLAQPVGSTSTSPVPAATPAQTSPAQTQTHKQSGVQTY